MKCCRHRFASLHFFSHWLGNAAWRCRSSGRYILLVIIAMCIVHTLVSTLNAHPFDQQNAATVTDTKRRPTTFRKVRQIKYCSVVNLTEPVKEDFNCVRTVCLYDVYRDMYISHDLQETGVWEPHVTRHFLDFLARDPTAGVIDLGANIGYYTMLAASAGRMVVAVEPYYKSVSRLHKAAILENVTANVVIVQNAVSDERTEATVRRVGDNQGDTRIRHGAEPCVGACSPVVRTIFLDDLLEVCRFNRAIIKIDIQNYEHRAFAHAAELFHNIRITYIFMEWVLMGRHFVAANHTSDDKVLVENMLRFLFERNYRPYTLSSDGERPLDPDVWDRWPEDIVWHLMPDTLEYGKLLRTHFFNWP